MILRARPGLRSSKSTSPTPLICHTDSVITESAPPPGSREDQEEPKQPQPVDPPWKSAELLFDAAASSPRHRPSRHDGASKKYSWQVAVKNPPMGQRTVHSALCTRAPAAILCAHRGVNSALTLTCSFLHHLSPIYLCNNTKSNPFLAINQLSYCNHFCKFCESRMSLW